MNGVVRRVLISREKPSLKPPMFSGIVETMGKVQQLRLEPPGMRLVLSAATVAAEAAIGDSIAVNGCCLTAVTIEGGSLGFDLSSETLSRTNLGRLASGGSVNLERSLRVGDQLGGHFVTGHVDTVGTLAERLDENDWSTFWFNFPSPIARQMVSKGSIAVDGVSLTLVDVEADRISVALIPHTLRVTTLGGLNEGDPVNLETDLLAKYVQKQLGGTGNGPN